MKSLQSMANTTIATLSNTTQQQESLRKWQALSEEEKQATCKRINAEFAPSQEAKYQERVRLSGIPKRYQQAQVTPQLQSLLDQLRSHAIVGVIMQGKTGRGKTYAASSMLLAHLNSSLGKFATFNEVLAHTRGAYSTNENPEEIFGRFKGTKLLVLDDLGKENISLDSITKLFELLDYRVNNELPTVITTQFTNNELMKRYTSKIDDQAMVSAVLSRLSQFSLLVFQGEDRRLDQWTA